MQVIKHQGTDDIPSVWLDAENEIFRLSGRSKPEDVYSFYEPILIWVENYIQKPNNKTIIDFSLEYFNTSSSKMLLDLMVIFGKLIEEKKELLFRWHYPSDNPDIEEAGKDYEEILEIIPFEFISYTP